MWWTRFHMWTKFRVNWSKTATCIASRQTDRQTNKQTNKQTVKRTYLQISSKFWQVINRRQKWINRVQNSPIPLIRGVDYESEVKLKIRRIVQIFTKWPPYSCKNNFWSRRDIKIYSYRQRCAIPRATFWAVDGRSSSKTDGVMAIFVSGGHLNMNIEDNVQSLTVTSSLTSSTLKWSFLG